MLNKIKNIKAQVGETITWVIATIIILAILMFFIFGAVTLSSTKSLNEGFKVSFVSSEVFEKGDAFLKKSIFTYQKIEKKEDKEFVWKKLEKMENKSEFNLGLEETSKEIMKRYLAR